MSGSFSEQGLCHGEDNRHASNLASGRRLSDLHVRSDVADHRNACAVRDGQLHVGVFAIGVAMLGMTAGALLGFYRFETTYSPARLSGAMARVMTYFAWSVLGSFGALLNLAVIPTFEPTLSFVASWTLTLLVLLPPYVLLWPRVG
jgi:hypothetical protein